jgi:acyl-coenzyme A thioesterase 13
MTDWRPLAKPSPYLDSIGPLTMRESDDGRVEISIVVEDRHCNARGRAHGGLVATLCDVALGHSSGRF